MREKQKQALQTELGDKVLAKIIIIQRWTRAKLLRCRFLHFRRSAIAIQVRIHMWYKSLHIIHIIIMVKYAVQVLLIHI